MTLEQQVETMQAVRANDVAEIARLRAEVARLRAACEIILRNAIPCEMDSGPALVDGVTWDDVLGLRAALTGKGGAE